MGPLYFLWKAKCVERWVYFRSTWNAPWLWFPFLSSTCSLLHKQYNQQDKDKFFFFFFISTIMQMSMGALLSSESLLGVFRVIRKIQLRVCFSWISPHNCAVSKLRNFAHRVHLISIGLSTRHLILRFLFHAPFPKPSPKGKWLICIYKNKHKHAHARELRISLTFSF